MENETKLRFRPIEAWPREWTKNRRASNFSAPYDATIDLLDRELCAISARNVAIQLALTPADIRRDGLPYKHARPSHPGVILSYELIRHVRGKTETMPISMPCDTFTKWEDNLRAIALTMEALRKIDRYGVTQNAEQYTGWLQLPAPSKVDLSRIGDATAFIAMHSKTGAVPSRLINDYHEAKASYRAAAKILHPDNGGDTGDFQRLQQARGTLEKHHGAKF